ncbi:MAG: TetR/AcrR family transcriptional regulator, partial [Planctomycetota bacterium]
MEPETRTDLSRKEKQHRWHRRLIIEAAEKLFSHQGFHATSMQEIAEAAEFSVGSLYKMFDSKEDLYRQIVKSRTEQYCEEAYARMDDESTPADKIRAVIDCKLDFFDDHR